MQGTVYFGAEEIQEEKDGTTGWSPLMVIKMVSKDGVEKTVQFQSDCCLPTREAAGQFIHFVYDILTNKKRQDNHRFDPKGNLPGPDSPQGEVN